MYTCTLALFGPIRRHILEMKDTKKTLTHYNCLLLHYCSYGRNSAFTHHMHALVLIRSTTHQTFELCLALRNHGAQLEITVPAYQK